MPGSAVSTRSSFSSASSVPSATHTMPGVDRAADADAAAVVDAHPRRARRRVDQRVEQRPVGDRVGLVLHPLRLAVGRGDRAGVEVVAADDDRRRQLAGAHHRVEAQAEPVALAVAEPADARRQALEGDPLAGGLDPAARAARRRGTPRARRGRSRRCPPGRPTARPSGTGPCPRRTAAARRRGRSPGRRTRARSRRASPRRAGCCRSRRPRRRGRGSRPSPRSGRPSRRATRATYSSGSCVRRRVGLVQRHAVRDVAAERVVGARLVGDDVGLEAGREQLAAARRRRCRPGRR